MYPFMINLLTIDAAFFLDLIHRNLISAILPLEVRFEELLAKYSLLLIELLNFTISDLLIHFVEKTTAKSAKIQSDELAFYYNCLHAFL